MRAKRNIPFNWSVLVVPIAFVLSLWVVFWIEIRFGVRLKQFGIYPGKLEGLWGIFSGPWIHSDLNHLSNNSLPMLFLLAALFYFYKPIAVRVLLIGLVLTGIMTWLIGRPSWHIGASGLIYMLVAFIFFKGVQSRIYPLIAVALTVVFLYGGLFWYLFPLDPKISWEGHSAGFIVGICLAFFFRKQQSHLYESYVWQSEEFDPEQDPFMRQFDEHGAFKPKEQAQKQDEEVNLIHSDIANAKEVTNDSSKNAEESSHADKTEIFFQKGDENLNVTYTYKQNSSKE